MRGEADNEIFNDFGRRPVYEAFYDQARQLLRNGWHNRQFLAFIDKDTGNREYFTYALSNGIDFVVYNESTKELELLIFDKQNQISERVSVSEIEGMYEEPVASPAPAEVVPEEATSS